MTARMTTQQRAALGVVLRGRYEQGESINELAAAEGRSYGAVHQLLADAGTTFRPRGGARRTRKQGA